MKLYLLVIVHFTLYWKYTNADCNVVSKKQWDGLNPMHVKYLPRPVNLVIIQHTVTSACTTDARCAEIVRSIQNQHMDVLNFWDIGYNFLIGGNGKVYEGAGWLHVGAHTRGYNSKALGIAFIGNFNAYAPVSSACAQELEKFWESVRDVLDLVEGNERVIMCGDLNGWVGTKRYSYEAVLGPYGDKRVNEADDEVKPAMIDAMKELLKCGVDNGHLTADYHIVAHRQLRSTESPGRKLYNIIRSLPQWLEDVSTIDN